MSTWQDPVPGAPKGRWSRDAAGHWSALALVVVLPIGLFLVFVLVNSSNPVAGWFLGVFLMSGLMGATVLRNRTRLAHSRAMTRWARRVGWVPLADPRSLDPTGRLRRGPGGPVSRALERSVVDSWRLPPFGMGGAVVEGALAGPCRGHRAVTFGYTAAGAAQLRATQLRYHVVALRLPRALPTVWVNPRLADAPAVAVGREVLVESAEFNDTWRVTGDDVRFTHAVLSPRVIERLLQPDALGLELRIEGATIVHWRLGNPEPASTERALAVLADVVDALPPFVWQPGEPGPG